MNFKNNLKDKTYRSMVIGASIFEGFVALIAYLSYLNGNNNILTFSIVILVIEVFSIGFKLNQYEKKVLGIGVR